VHRNGRLVANTIAQLEAQLGRDVKDSEVAEKLEISIDEYHQMINEVSSGKIIGIEDLGVSEDVIVAQGSDSVRNQPFEGMANAAFQNALVKAIGSLPEREALVLSLYYDDELNLREIGEVLSVSESRVSQIHSQAMMRVKSRMQAWV
jgi:RNA polymerase sigma factor for flagellar operon FliA